MVMKGKIKANWRKWYTVHACTACIHRHAHSRLLWRLKKQDGGILLMSKSQAHKFGFRTRKTEQTKQRNKLSLVNRGLQVQQYIEQPMYRDSECLDSN